MYLGNGSLDSVLFNCFKSGLGVVTGAASGPLYVGGSAERFAFGSIGFGGHTCQFLFDQAKLVQELAKGLTLSSICGRKVQSSTRARRGTCSQFQTPDIEDIESNFVAFVNLAQHILYRNFGILQVDLASRRAFNAHLTLFRPC